MLFSNNVYRPTKVDAVNPAGASNFVAMRLLAILVLLSFGFADAGLAQLAAPQVGCLPLDVKFSAPDNGGAFWDFGDGVTSTLPNPNHIYTAAGTFTVVVRRAVGGAELGRTTVTVYPKPTLSLAVDSARGCLPHPVQFGVTNANPTGVTVEGYSWAFGDGTAGSGQDPTHTYTTAGTFDVSVRLQTNLATCNVTQVFPEAVRVNPAPTVAFSTDPSPAQSCDAPLTVRVVDQSTGQAPLAYRWDFGNGRTTATRTPAPVTYTRPGAYQIDLSVTDGNGCVGTATRPVSVGGPNPDFTLPDTVCFNVPYLVRPLGAADTYAYTYGPGVSVLDDQGAAQRIVFTRAGATTVGLAVTNTVGNCAADTTRTIFVQRVVIDATADPSYVCSTPFDVRFRVNSPAGRASWIIEDTLPRTFSSRDTTISLAYDEGGEYGYNWYEFTEANVTVTTPQGCSADTSIFVTTDVPNALMIPDRHYGCAPLTVTFADSVRSTQVVSSYVIDWGDGTTATFTAPGPWPHTYTTPGEYTASLTITNAAGCTDTSYGIDIQVGTQIPNLTFTVDEAGTCPGDTLTFVNTTADARIDAVKFRVEGGDDFHCASDNRLEHVLTRPIDGNAIDAKLYVEYNGCIDSVSRTIAYEPIAFADLGYAIDCDTIFDVTFFNRSLNSTSDSIFVQGVTDPAFRQNLLATGLDSIELILPARGTYRAILQSQGSSLRCGPSRDTVEFYITLPKAVFDIPALICSGNPLVLDATQCQDANPSCNKGYQWDFSWQRPYVTSDATLDEMEVVAGARGAQYVELIIEDINGCVDTTRRNTRLFATVPVISADKDRLCFPGTVNFTVDVSDADTTVTEFMWDFGGLGTSTERNPSFTFPDAPGADTIVVTLTTTDALSCDGMATYVLTRYRPISRVTTQPSPPFICAGESVRFQATDFTAEGSNLSYAWDFGNGQTSQNRIENVVYATAGTFDAVLNYTEVATGCRGDTTVRVVVEQPPVPSFTSDIDGQALVCYPAIVTFTDRSTSPSATTAVWEVNGVTGSGPTFTTSLGRGLQTVRLTSITNLAGCAATTERTFELVGPAGDFDAAPDVICVGSAVTFSLKDTVDVGSFTWDFGNGQTVTGVNPATTTYTFAPPSGFTVVSLKLESQQNECTFTRTDTLRFTEVVADFVTEFSDSFACSPTVRLFDQSTGASRLQFTFPDGTTSTSGSPTFNFGAPGVYSVRLTASTLDGACRDDTTKTITVLAPLAPTATVIPACPGQGATITLAASRGGLTFRADPSNLIANQVGNVLTTVPLTRSQQINVTVFDSVGCTATIEGLAVPIAPVYTGRGDTTTIFVGGEAQLTVTGTEGFTLRWQNPEAVGCADCPNPTVRPTTTTDYVLNVSDAGGCAPRVIVFRVIVADEPIVPTLFSPNADGTNDTWRPLFPEGTLPTVEVYQVFSRWGSLVFESSDPEAEWSGDNNGGGDAPSDVYTYVLKLSFPGDVEFNKSGEVTLLR